MIQSYAFHFVKKIAPQDFPKEQDYSTVNFLQWYVAEQHEEEHTMQKILDKIKNIGESGSGVYFIDRAIGAIAGQK